MLREGAEVFAVARRDDRIADWSAKLPKSDLRRLQMASLDVCDRLALQKFVRNHESWLQGLDVLFNNAGLALGTERLQDAIPEDLVQVINTNVLGVLECTRLLLPFLIHKKSGLIVNMGSIAGITAYQGGTVYCASKAAIHMMTDCLRMDVGGTGVRVTTLAPGRVETDFSLVRFRGDPSKAAAVYSGLRALQPSDIAEAFRWVVGLPEHVCIPEMVIMPTDQPSATTLAPLKPQ
jgi:NADP-dependent 3-hydroxy acid dehydrogenase YdfG